MNKMTSADIGWRLDRLALSRFHWRVLTLIAAGMFFDSFDLYLAGGVLAALVQSGESTLALNAMFISATFFGMMIGAWFAGLLGDRFGRKFSYQFNLLIFGLASLAGAASPSMNWLIAARFVMGLGLGAEIVVGYGTLSEFIPARHRGRFAALLNAIINSSLFIATILGWVIIPNVGWRWMFVIVAVGAFVVWFLRRSLPESPRWLASQGRLPEAEAIVRRAEQESSPLEAGLEPAYQGAPSTQYNLASLFGPALIRRTLVATVVTISLLSFNFAFVSWVPTFLVKQGHGVANSLGLSALMFAGGPLGSIIGLLLTERIGRRWGLIWFSVLGIIVSAVYVSVTSSVLIGALGFLVTLVIYVLSSLSIACYVPELFPTEVRLRGTGIANAAGRAVNIVVPYIIAASFEGFGLYGVLMLIAGFLLLQIVVLLVFGIETKQRSLEELATEPGDVGAARRQGAIRPATS
jgi:MFS transporter, putative metabolite:H+ symporter